MKEYNIKMSPLEFLTVLDLKVEKEMNQHGRLVVSGYIEDEKEEAYLEALSNSVWEKAEALSNTGEAETLFWGIVTDFSFETVNDQKKMTLELKTGSCLMDIKKHLRSFQDQAVTYQQIFQQVVDTYHNAGILFNSSLSDRNTGLILQYEETDWEFLKRLASRKHTCLVPESRREGSRVYYDLTAGEKFDFPEEERYWVQKDLQEYRIKKEGGLPQASEADSLVYIIRSRESHSIGDVTRIKGREFFIYRIQSSYTAGELLHDYYLKSKKGLEVPQMWQNQMRGNSLDAIVIKVKEDKVQIGIMEDENKSQNISVWYPYATVYSTADGTGWYCMPEPGDRVRLTIPEKEEKEAFVTSSVHLETESADRKDPNHKVIKSKYQKEIRFTPDSIVITNNQGTKIELTDAEGIHIVSAHSVMLQAAEDLTISSDTGSLIAAGTTAVNIKQKGTSINLENGISFTGGELKVQ